MKLYVSVLLFVLVLFGSQDGVACWAPPEPSYSAPDYIDAGHRQPPTHEFMLLMHDYADANVIEARDPYTEKARLKQTGKRGEDYRKADLEYASTLVNLLKAKNVSTAIFDAPDLSVCPNNNRANVLAFVRSVVEDPSIGAAAVDLARVRHGILLLCSKPSVSETKAAAENRQLEGLIAMLSSRIAALQQTKETRAYADYLEALMLLYGNKTKTSYGLESDFLTQNLPRALELMRQVQKASADESIRSRLGRTAPKLTWLHQTSTYLIARLQLIMAQKDWDGETTPVKADAELLRKAKDAYAEYLSQYPEGIYAESARNIQRKILFLQNDREALNRELEARIAKAFAFNTFSKSDFDAAYDAFTEFKIHYGGDNGLLRLSPLVAFYVLLRNENPPPDSLDVLQMREKDFKQWPGLFILARAHVLYSQKDYEKLLELTPFVPVTKSVVSRSVEALRARAFEALGKKAEAIEAWKNIARAAPDAQAQIHIAGLYASTGAFEKTFSKDSGVTDEHVFGDFALFAAKDAQLWGVLEMPALEPVARAMVQKALFRRLLLKRDYVGIQKLIQRFPEAEGAKDIAGDLAVLAQNPNDADARVNVAIYIYEKYLKPSVSVYAPYAFLYSAEILDELKSVCPTCKAIEGAISPYADFIEAEKTFSLKNERSESEAKTLHYLINCFRGRESVDRCRWSFEENPENRGKLWFKRLHSLYPRSEWTEKIRYYY